MSEPLISGFANWMMSRVIHLVRATNEKNKERKNFKLDNKKVRQQRTRSKFPKRSEVFNSRVETRKLQENLNNYDAM